MENNLIINISNFNLCYGQLQLFKDFNLTVEKGKCAGIFGPTGTGKTSLLNKIAEEYIKKYKIAYVFQDNKLLENFSVKKNIAIPLKNVLEKEQNKYHNDYIEEKVQEILELVNLGEKINQKVSVLSGGEHQRVNIARAFAYVMEAPCHILLMDEPFSAQDEENRERLINLTKSICKEKNITSVIVSHNKDDLQRLCDFIVEI